MKHTYKPIPSQRIERWLGTDRAEQLSRNFRDWPGPPVKLIDVPDNVWIAGGGEFVGTFERGFFYSAADSFYDHLKNLWKASGHVQYGMAAAGFANLGDALARASGGFSQNFNGNIAKSGPTGVIGVASSLWRVGTNPGAGAAGSAAPGGRSPTSSTTGAMAWTNPAAGTMRLTGADFSSSIINNSLMLYDRFFDVAKTMNSTATEAVTGTPTRLQSTTTTSEDYIGGNFCFVEVFTALPATAHNWTTCTYTDQAGAASTFPSMTGNSSAIIDRLDHPVNSWFMPMESGDSGVQKLTQIQCSAAVASGAINFVLGHSIGIMSFPVINSQLPFDWLTNRKQAPYIPASACLALLEMPKPATTATTYSGQIYGTSTAS